MYKSIFEKKLNKEHKREFCQRVVNLLYETVLYYEYEYYHSFIDLHQRNVFEHSYILTYINIFHLKICKQIRPLSYDIKSLNGRKNANIRQVRVSF